MKQRQWTGLCVVLLGLGASTAFGQTTAQYDLEAARAYFTHLAPLPATSMRGTTFRDSAGSNVFIKSFGDDKLDGRVYGTHGNSLYDPAYRERIWEEVCRELVMQPLASPRESTAGLLSSVRAAVGGAEEAGNRELLRRS